MWARAYINGRAHTSHKILSPRKMGWNIQVINNIHNKRNKGQKSPKETNVPEISSIQYTRNTHALTLVSPSRYAPLAKSKDLSSVETQRKFLKAKIDIRRIQSTRLHIEEL